MEVLWEVFLNFLFYGYGLFRGYFFLKEVIVVFYKREYGVLINFEMEVVFFGGGKVGLYVLI